MKLFACRYLVAAALSLCLSGCGINSTISHDYVAPDIDQMQLSGVLVVAVAQKDEARRTFENAFVKSLQRRGANAVASYTLVPALDADGEEIIEAAEKAGLDSILVTRYIGETVQEVYHPGTSYYGVMPAVGPYYGGRGYYGYYGQAYEIAYQQPVWTTNRSYTLISDLFATETKEHLWEAVSDTIRSGSKGELRDDVINGFIRNMKDNNVLD
jgi:hypothetical protein